MREIENSVPERMLGCWKRRYIKFKDGTEDTSTTVIWLQTVTGMVDIRIPQRDTDYFKGESLQDYSTEQLINLATQDCGTGITGLDETTKPYARASWDSNELDAYVQPVSLFPEDGWLDWQDDGKCMMEWAPSGAYEEDWRLQENSRSLIAEFHRRDSDKSEFVYIAGDHLAYVRDRKLGINEKRPLWEIAEDNKNNKDYLISLLDIEFSYASRIGKTDEFLITHSTLPFRVNQKLSDDLLPNLNMKPGKNKNNWRRISLWTNDGGAIY